MAEGVAYLIPGNFYHIYNHGNGSENIYYNDENYNYFLKKYKEYISPVAETYAYCLMPNHFHFLIQIKPADKIFHYLRQNNKLPERSMNQEEFELLFKNSPSINLFGLHISKQFSNLFNGYTQAVNKQQGRKGSLFLRSFKRREVGSSEYLKSLILYIHLNPVHHGFVEKISDWKYLSYHSVVSDLETLLKRKEVIELFDDIENFKFAHRQINQNILMEIEADLID